MDSRKQPLEVTELPLDLIAPYEANPREHPETQIKMIVASIEKHNFVNPVLVGPLDEATGKHELIAGHGRLIAAQRLGMNVVPAITLSHLDEHERRAYRLADNAIALKSEWSFELLQAEIEFQMDFDVDFSPIALGFEVGEADALAEAHRKSESEEIPEVVEEPDRNAGAVSQPGVIWTVGPHRIACGDSLDPAVMAAVMEGCIADVAICDMPFNVPINGHVSSTSKHSEFAQASGEMSDAEFAEMIAAALALQAEHLRPGALSYQFIDWRSVATMIDAGLQSFEALINIAVWVKPSAGMGSFLRSRHELICIFRKAGAMHSNNVELGVHGRNRSNVWEYPGCTGFSDDRQSNLAMHPTVKNTQMIADAIMDCTAPGDVVLDAFLGSGTTALAAARTKRTCFGIDIDPHYVDLAVRRLVEVTSEKAFDQHGNQFPAAGF